MNLRTAVTAALFLLASTACGTGKDNAAIRPDNATPSTAPGDGTQQSGSRLRALSFVNRDGSKAPFGWMDTQLNTTCSFKLLFGSTGACVPDDVYAIPYTSTSSLSTSNPGFYLDATCNGTPQGIIAHEYQKCASYGLVRFDADRTPGEIPSCGTYAGDRYMVADPIDIKTTKIYRYDVPAGGGACCSCNEVTSLKDGDVAYVLLDPSEETLAKVKLVTGTLDLPSP